MLAALTARLETEVSEFRERVYPAKDFFALVAARKLPQHDLVAYVIPEGLQGGPADVAAGLFRQPITETISVVICLQDRARGRRALTRLDAFLADVVGKIAGWGPAGAVGVFQLRSGRLLSTQAGLVAYQLTFSIEDQLRIAS